DAAAQLQGKKSMMNKEGGQTMTGHEGHTGMDESATKTKDEQTNMNNRIEVSKDFQNQLKTVFQAYIKLKDNLVKDDPVESATDAKSILEGLNQVNMKLLTDNTVHDQWMLLEKEIKSAANAISNASDLTEQRDHFKHLSSHLAHAIERFGVNEKVYQQFCPMADNNNGAHWLSLDEQILNPYFGASMLKCGSVKQTIE
ncbi:MAG: DUF3347 domain-containing protein, partial [Bacteroidia bacterium]|nr:DUF3347 domain-containing protein [Bacteroidia bacterium]